MKSAINYKVVGKSTKETKTIENLKKYIATNYNVSGKRLGISNFIKEFGKFNDEKETLQASSVVSVKDIQTACRLVSEETKRKGKEKVIPCIISKNAIITIETKNIDDFELYYPTIKIKTTPKKTPTEFIINYINKHENEIDIKAIQTALDGLKD